MKLLKLTSISSKSLFIFAISILLYACNQPQNAPTSQVSNCSCNGLLSVVIDHPSDPPYILYVQPSDNAQGIQWDDNNSFVTTGTFDEWDGKANTDAIVNAIGNQGNYAAKVCNDLTANGCNDWYLPAKEELKAIYNQLGKDGSNAIDSTSGAYWSSTEVQGRTEAWTVNFLQGSFNNHLKNQSFENCRCVRRAKCCN